MMHGTDVMKQTQPKATTKGENSKQCKDKVKVHCPYCDEEHWLNQCESFSKMDKMKMLEWIKANRRCCSIDRCFYVDNCLQSVSTEVEARGLVTNESSAGEKRI